MQLIPHALSKNKTFLFALLILAVASLFEALRAQAETEGAHAVIVQSGDWSLKAAELPDAIDLSRAVAALQSGQTPGLTALHHPQIAEEILRELIGFYGLEQAAFASGWLPAAAEIAAYIPEDDASAAQRFGLDIAQLHHAAAILLTHDALHQRESESLSQAQIEAQFKADHHQLRLRGLRLHRAPESSEIDLALKNRQPEIARYYQQHPALFSTPAKWRATRISKPFTALNADEVEAELRELQQNLDENDLSELTHRGFKTETVFVSDRHHRFQAHQKTPIARHAQTLSFDLLLESFPEQKRDINEVSVQRECAAAVLIELDDLPTARKTADEGRQLLSNPEALKAYAEAHAMRIFETPFFSESQKALPSVGLITPEIQRDLLSLTPDAPLSGLHVLRQDYVAFELLEERAAPPFEGEEAAKYAFLQKERFAAHLLETLKRERQALFQINADAYAQAIRDLLKDL